jgi:hypothetical protein
MDANVLAALSPEERAALKAALEESESNPMDDLAEAVKYLCGEIDSVKEMVKTQTDAHDALKKLVMEELIGGLAEAYNSNKEAEEFEGFKGKHGGMFEPFAEKFKSTYGVDLLDRAFKHLRELQGEEGYSDEVGSSELEKIVNQIKERLGFEEPVAAVEAVKVEKPAEGEADEEPDDDTRAAWNEIEAMKRRDDYKEARKKGA